MMSDADRKKAADILIAAETARKQAVQLSKTWPGITIDDAYAISSEVAARKIAAGAKLIGHKVGLTSKAMQRSSQIDEPDYGYLLDHMMVADGARVAHESYCLPRVEIELAFILGKPLRGPGAGLPDVLRATEYVVPAIEIVDARLQDQRKIFDTVSDNGAAAGLIIGGRPIGPLDVDLRWVGGIMYRNSEIEETGVAAGVLGHPALGVAWLANKLGQHGVTLEAGHIVLAGSFAPHAEAATRPIPLNCNRSCLESLIDQYLASRAGVRLRLQLSLPDGRGRRRFDTSPAPPQSSPGDTP